MSKQYRVAIVGATGAVGRELLAILAERKFPVSELVPFSSPRSEGKAVTLNGKSYLCQVLCAGAFAGVDFAFFDASDAVSREWVPEAARAGAWVIDNSAAFRMDEDIPLVVPEVNGHLIEKCIRGKANNPRARIIAGPNCSTAQLVVALKPLHEKFGIKRVVVSTYQSASGAGSAAMEELATQTRAVLDQQTVASKAFVHRIAFNCIPQIGGFKPDFYTGEEEKIMAEAKKILGLPGLRINATAIRVPTFSCHGESVNVECERSLTVESAREAFKAQAGVVLLDEPGKNVYPMGASAPGSAVEAATGRDAVYVGRVRRDDSVEQGLSFWVVSDNLRKGAALNAIQIGEEILGRS